MKVPVMVGASLAVLMLVASPVQAEGERGRGERGGEGREGNAAKWVTGVVSAVTKTEEKVTGLTLSIAAGDEVKKIEFVVNGETSGVDLAVEGKTVSVKYTEKDDVKTAVTIQVKAEGEGRGEGEKRRER